jgi:hypothetical protein
LVWWGIGGDHIDRTRNTITTAPEYGSCQRRIATSSIGWIRSVGDILSRNSLHLAATNIGRARAFTDTASKSTCRQTRNRIDPAEIFIYRYAWNRIGFAIYTHGSKLLYRRACMLHETAEVLSITGNAVERTIQRIE